MSTLTFGLDLEINAGSTLAETYTYAIDGVPVNFTGATARMQLRRNALGAALMELTTQNGKLTLSSVGVVTINLTAVETAALSGKGVYDLEVVYANGTVQRLIEGAFIVYPEVTR
jgi:hypothetical protein